MKNIDLRTKTVPHFIWGTIIFTILVSTVVSFGTVEIMAIDTSSEVIGTYYEFDVKNNYEFSTIDSSTKAVSGQNTLGKFSLTGNFAEDTKKEGLPVFTVKDGNISLIYTLESSIHEVGETKWHLTDDKSKKIDNLTLKNNIMLGALVLQSSLDGKKWLDDVIITDFFSEENKFEDLLYITKDIQQQNGCYYRLIVVYSLERKVGEKKIGFITVDVKEEKKVAEVYNFYVIDEDVSQTTSSSDTPKKKLGKKVNTGKDTGYSGSTMVNLDDPHYGWDIGTFFVNGYTREVIQKDGSSIFLKNVGDRVTLWFSLVQELDQLNGDDDLVISEDTNGHDKEFEIVQTDFGRGALIISYTDYQGVVHKPVIYTNYLAANARTGADTRVQLFEEGDYEVALDYEIMDNSRKIGSLSLLPTYFNYKIRFSFSIRNGNCMVYPFDTETGVELSERAITENGFRLDMAKSRYLTIDVKKSVVKISEDGSIVEDIRFNRPAKDGESYTEEGIYTFTVKNLYTGGDSTTKTIFVGSNKYVRAISRSGFTLVELNDKIVRGATISEEGLIIEPIEETSATTEDKIIQEEPVKETVLENEEAANNVEEITNETDDTNETENTEDSTIIGDEWTIRNFPIVPTSIVVVIIIALVLVFRKRKSA
ncbi:MAG: hypothetical protein KMY55_01155 [Dethiosulfatibacter sp.]|nr:hypothetical protein [Dethiosulfatibacter sp.]